MLSYDDCLEYVNQKHQCPHCDKLLSCCHAPPFHVGDGLGWGSEVLYICLNDECPIFVKGWQTVEDQYGHVGSFRYMLLPGETKGEVMMVAHKDAFTGSEVIPDEIKASNDRYQKEREAVSQFDTSIKEKNLEPALCVILDEKADPRNREKACDVICKINDMSCFEALKNHEFKNTNVEYKASLAVNELLKGNYMRECPDCKEVIKIRANVCKHCGKQFSDE